MMRILGGSSLAVVVCMLLWRRWWEKASLREAVEAVQAAPGAAPGAAPSPAPSPAPAQDPVVHTARTARPSMAAARCGCKGKLLSYTLLVTGSGRHANACHARRHQKTAHLSTSLSATFHVTSWHQSPISIHMEKWSACMDNKLHEQRKHESRGNSLA